MAAYLFVHFTEERDNGEQVFFAVSRDGLHWQDLNGGKPILYSDVGEKGIRDPFMVQHPETGMYHLIATDLCVYNRQHDWYGAVHSGSRDILVWDSADLVRWEGPRVITLAPEGAGCAWAPEAIWDEEKGAFLVIFAPYTKEENGARHRIYASYTKDFKAFTPAFKYIEREQSVIDTTIIHTGGMYYRFSKDETTSRIKLDKGASLQGAFTPVASPVLDELDGLEGPECYQLPDGRWCLICDQFKRHGGYLPIIIEDIDRGDMHPLTPGEYDLGSVLKRHGGVLRIDDAAYDRLMEAFA